MRTHPASTPASHDPHRAVLETGLRELIRIAAAMSAFCEHVEHNEPLGEERPADTARRLRRLATSLAMESDLNIFDLYRQRIAEVEQASIHRFSSIPGIAHLGGAEAMRDAKDWTGFQVAQLIHDRQFHPDVFGMSKLDQIRHYTFHVTKLAGLMAEALDNESWECFARERLPDLAIFGVKIATVCNQTLEPL